MLIVDYDDADDLIGDYTENLSTGGTFIHTERGMEIDTEVQLVLSFPGLVRPIRIDGVVRWTRDIGEPSGDPGIGIEFVHADGEVLRQLELIIGAIARRDPGYVGQVVHVLVVDDNPHVARLLREGLAGSADKFGDRIVFAFAESGDGQSALAMCRARRFHAAIIDVHLPVLDGIEVIAELRSDPALRGLPIIAVSAGGRGAREAALAAGADLFLDKPMRLRQVIESMQALLEIGRRDG